MDRRSFLKTAFIFTGALWVPKTGILRQSEARMNVGIVGGGTVEAGGDGPNVWYYSGPGTDTFASETTQNASEEYGNQVTCTVAGTITQIGVKIKTADANAVKLWLGKDKVGTVWTKHEIVTKASITAGWNDVTLVTPLSVSAGAIMLVIFNIASGNTVYYNSGYNGHWAASKTYATWNPATITLAADTGYGYGVRVYVD